MTEDEQKIYEWLLDEAASSIDMFNQIGFSQELTSCAWQRSIYYKEIASMIKNGEHKK